MNKMILTIGILCFLVPTVLQVADKKEQVSIIDTYQKEVEQCETDRLEKVFENAQKYNATLYELKQSSVGKEIVLDYESQLNVTSTGMMGHLEISKINLHLPIYHGTSEDVLSIGVGHLEGTSLPTGGENVHTVLTGHCGLPSAELFTRLDEMKIGDEFHLHICNRTLEYRVIEVQVVEPQQVDVIEIERTKDLATLITCTPYGLNTHRLIVTGERVEIQGEMLESDVTEETTEGGVDEKIYYIMGIGTLLLVWMLCGGIHWASRYFGK